MDLKESDLKKLREIMKTSFNDNLEIRSAIYPGVSEIKVRMIDWPRRPYASIFEMVTATWGNEDYQEKWDRTSLEGRRCVLEAALTNQTLSQALEAPSFTFMITGTSRSSFDQIARARIGAAFASMGVRDNSRADAGFRMPLDIWQNKKLRKKVINHFNATKKLYVEILRENKSSWQSARSILPMGMTHHFLMSINYLALKGQCARRLMFCLHPSNIVVGNLEAKPIPSWTTRENVLTHTGSFQEIDQTFKHEIDMDIVKLRLFCLFDFDYLLTPEHLAYGVRRKTFDPTFETGNNFDAKQVYKDISSLEQSLGWIPVGLLKGGDIVAYPIIHDVHKKSLIELENKKFSPKKFNVPSQIILDSDIMKICGFFMAEGYKSSLSLGPSDFERGYVAEIIDVLRKIFGERKWLRKDSKKIMLPAPLGRFLDREFGSRSLEKKVPTWLLFLDWDLQEEFMRWWARGDGMDNEREYFIVTGSLTAAVQGFNIFLRSDKDWTPTLVKREKEKTLPLIQGRPVNAHDKYELHFRKQDSSMKSRRSWKGQDYAFFLVRDSEWISYKGLVFNFKVVPDESFCLPGLIVHNCEQPDTVAVFWRIWSEVSFAFPVLGAYLLPACDQAKKCVYHQAYTLSEAFSCLFKGCGRWPSVNPDASYFDFPSCTREELMEQLGFYIPERGDWTSIQERAWEKDSLWKE